MSVSVNLSSQSEGVLKNFLDVYFEKDCRLDNDVYEWINVFNKPLEAIDLITSVVDNNEVFDIQMLLSMDPEIYVEVTPQNLEQLVKFMVYRYYKES